MTHGYDALAWFYDRYWRSRYHDAARPALDRLLYRALAPGSRVVDLCCGTGHLTRDLANNGYSAVGVDRSLEMLRIARRRVPAARFVCADARAFDVGRADAIVSTFDSINHLVTPDDVETAFRTVRRGLSACGLFVFDVNTSAAYESEWGKSSAVVDTDAALFVRGSYDRRTRIGTTDITMFRLNGQWTRRDARIEQRCYDENEIRDTLAASGFADVVSLRAVDAGMTGDIAVGRCFFACRAGS